MKKRLVAILTSLGLAVAGVVMALPPPSASAATPTLTFWSYDIKKGYWLSAVTDTSASSTAFAGNYGNPMGGLQVRLSSGGSVTVQMHGLGGAWYSASTANAPNAVLVGNTYMALDALMITTNTGLTVNYRVHTVGRGWLPWVTGFNTADSRNGYAGILGQAIDGVQMYLSGSQTNPGGQWIQSGSSWYYYQNGVKLTGWRLLNWSGGQNWFYFDANGVMLTGWQKLAWSGGTDWFYFEPVTGIMATGWWNIGGRFFYFEAPSGKMLMGYQYLAWSGGNSWFYLNPAGESGAMLTGCQWVNGRWHYFNPGSGDESPSKVWMCS